MSLNNMELQYAAFKVYVGVKITIFDISKAYKNVQRQGRA